MSAPLGFVILSHNAPEQLRRLVVTLNRLYGDPPIAIHHDFSQSTVDVARFPANARFVQPSLKTRWSDIACIHAVIAGVRLLYEGEGPAWFTLLSAADYPSLAPDKVVAELAGNPYDLYIDGHAIERNPEPIADPAHSCMGANTVEWRRIAYDRYIAKEIRFPSLTSRLRPTTRGIVIRSELLRRPFIPFTSTWKCYAGDFWFTGNGKVARILLSAAQDHPETFDYLKGRLCPEEAVQHTILCNRSDLRICKDNKRYTNWLGQVSHPRIVGLEDLEPIERLGSHFARKFSPTDSGPVLAELDRRLGLA